MDGALSELAVIVLCARNRSDHAFRTACPDRRASNAGLVPAFAFSGALSPPFQPPTSTMNSQITAGFAIIRGSSDENVPSPLG